MFKKFFNNFLNFLKNNKQFIAYVVLSLICMTGIRFYTIGGFFELQPFFIDLGLILFLGSFCFLGRPQKQFIYLFILIVLYTTTAVANAIYFNFFDSFASISLLTAITQVGDVDDAFYAGLHWHQFIFILAPLIFILINYRLRSKDYFNFVAKSEKGKKNFKNVFIVSAVILAILATTLSGVAWSRLMKQWNREYIVNKFGMVGYQLNDLVNILRPTIISWFGQDVAMRRFHEFFENYPFVKSNNEYTGIFEGKNLVFVHMESMAGWLVDLKINDQYITPNLNRLVDEGIYLSNFYPQIGVGTSSDSEFTLLASLMPSTRGTVFVSYFDRTYVTIPRLLRDQGSYTFSMHGNKASMWNRHVMHPRLGYMDFYSSTSFEEAETIGLGISDKAFFEQALPILEEIERNNDNYMGKIITLTHHTPFEKHELFRDLDLTYNNGEHDFLRGTRMGDYLISSHYADEAMGLFLEMIEESDYFNDTVFVFYGDHDPRLSLREFNLFYNFDPETGGLLSSDHEDFVLYDFYANELNRRTPFIIWTKNQTFDQSYDYFMGTIDVLPTLGNMFGFYNEFAVGNDIFEIRKDNIVTFPNGNFLTNKVYYNSTREEYRAISLEEILTEDYINYCRHYAESVIEVSNAIIVHDIIRRVLEERG
jgi:phosphoglycerol transferase MdoB-like AlkP superfamily enzyme